MQIVRYRHYPQSDLSAALKRLTNMRAEMDRAFESTSSFSGSPVPLSRWNPAVNVYQDKDRFTVVVELPGLKKEEIEISLHDDTLTIAGERKTRRIQRARIPYRKALRQIPAQLDTANCS